MYRRYTIHRWKVFRSRNKVKCHTITLLFHCIIFHDISISNILATFQKLLSNGVLQSKKKLFDIMFSKIFKMDKVGGTAVASSFWLVFRFACSHLGPHNDHTLFIFLWSSEINEMFLVCTLLRLSLWQTLWCLSENEHFVPQF